MCQVWKIHLLAVNGLLWTAIGTKIAVTGVSHYLTTPPEKLGWMIPLSILVFAWFYLGLGLGLLSAGVRFLIRWWKGKMEE